MTTTDTVDDRPPTAVELLTDAFGPVVAERIARGETLHPGRRLARRIYRLLEDRGGSAIHAHLCEYLAALLGEDEDHVRNVVCEEIAAGVLHVRAAGRADWRQVLEIVR